MTRITFSQPLVGKGHPKKLYEVHHEGDLVSALGVAARILSKMAPAQAAKVGGVMVRTLVKA